MDTWRKTVLSREKAWAGSLSQGFKVEEGSGWKMVILPRRAAARSLGSKQGNPG